MSEVLGGVCKESFFEDVELTGIVLLKVEKEVLLSGSVDDLPFD